MNDDPAPRLTVQSDLRLAVGDLDATLVSDGARLTLHTADAPALLEQAAGVPFGLAQPPPLRELVGRVAGALDDAGLALRVADDRGTILELGDGCRSMLGRFVLHADHVRLGGVRALGPIAASYLRTASAVRHRVATAVAGLTIATVLATAVARRRRTGRDRTLP